ncbi:MAG: hypothetical protein HY558_00395 [Euryarchaeota archaeon]|nr:hypothetical protein [Euryarchaeota archaeon]
MSRRLLRFCAVAAGLGLAVEGTARALNLWRFQPEEAWVAQALLWWGGVYGVLSWKSRDYRPGAQMVISAIPGYLSEKVNSKAGLWTFPTPNGEFLGLPKPWGMVLLTLGWAMVVPLVAQVERALPGGREE